MRKVKAIFHVFLNSLLPHYPFYHTLLKVKIVDSIKYFLLLTFLTSLISVIAISIKLYSSPSIHTITENMIKSLQSYPSDLQITIRDGKVMSNYDRPYFLWMAHQDKKVLLLVIDENGTKESIGTYNSLFLLTNDELFIKSPTSIEKIPILNLNLTLDYQAMQKATNILQVLLRIFLIALPFILIIFIFLAAIIVNLLYSFITSTIVYVTMKLFLHHLSFIKTVQLSFHAISLPLIINYILGIISIKPDIFPLIFLSLYIIFEFAAVYEAHFKKTELSVRVKRTHRTR